MSVERDEIATGAILKVIAAAVVVMILSLVVARAILPGVPVSRTVVAPARSVPSVDLDSYGWVDRDAGIARIPIERAMDLVAKDGGP